MCVLRLFLTTDFHSFFVLQNDWKLFQVIKRNDLEQNAFKTHKKNPNGKFWVIFGDVFAPFAPQLIKEHIFVTYFKMNL